MPRDTKRNLYRIDDVLLRTGGWAALAVVAATAGLVVVGLAEGSSGDTDAGLAMLGRHAFLLALAATCPVALLSAGVVMRRREKQALSFWKLIQQNVEIYAPDLVRNSDYTRADLERCVRLLNNKALGFYVWDRESDLIRDGRLEASYLHVEKCDVCRASIALQVPASLREIPLCPYCGDPISIDSLKELKREALESMREEHAPPRAASQALPVDTFSIVVFLLLLVTFWPAAVVYGWYKWQARSEA